VLRPILLFATLFSFLPAQAGVWLQGGIGGIFVTERTSNGSEISRTHLLTDYSAGYTFAQGFFVGGQLLDARNSASGRSARAWGPKGGLLIDGFELTAAYLLSVKDDSTGFERSGRGLSAQIGYNWSVAGPVLVGAYFQYFSANLDEENGLTLNPRAQVSTFAPLLKATLHF
jgi:hypothetical protein